MKKTYFYSEKQKNIIAEHQLQENKTPYINVAPNGEFYTECATNDGEQSSNFEDAKVVCIEHNCGLDELFLKLTGERHAE